MRENPIFLALGVVLAMLGLAYLAKSPPEVKTEYVTKEVPVPEIIRVPEVIRIPEIRFVDRPQIIERVIEKPVEKACPQPTEQKAAVTNPPAQEKQHKAPNQQNSRNNAARLYGYRGYNYSCSPYCGKGFDYGSVPYR